VLCVSERRFSKRKIGNGFVGKAAECILNLIRYGSNCLRFAEQVDSGDYHGSDRLYPVVVYDEALDYSLWLLLAVIANA
jgi:hypothetical protein